MAYSDQATLSRDGDFAQRLAACGAVEVDDAAGDPLAWASTHQWEVAASPGFADAYGSALVNGVERPGWDASVISDGQILSAVQTLYPNA